MSKNVGIAIPSFNESANIPLLIKKIFTYLPHAYVVIIDDSSIKENKKLKDALQKNSLHNTKNILLISRLQKKGRGDAVLTGFDNLLKNKSIHYFFEMDADLAHDPKELEKFIKASKRFNADMVIGSRYLKESNVIDWPLFRYVLSKFYNIVINIWLGLSLTDYTDGYRLYKRGAVEFLTTIELREKGFIALSEIAYRLKNNNFNIIEIPITFKDRTFGKSSAVVHEYISALIGIVRIRLLPVQKK